MERQWRHATPPPALGVAIDLAEAPLNGASRRRLMLDQPHAYRARCRRCLVADLEFAAVCVLQWRAGPHDPGKESDHAPSGPSTSSPVERR